MGTGEKISKCWTMFRGVRSRNRHSTEEETQIIGIVGAGKAVGVTHLSILMANYCCSGCGKKTAVLEWNGHGDFARFGDSCTGAGSEAERYRILGVDYYQKADGRRLAQCIKDRYQRIVIDFGSMQELADAEHLRCHKVYLVVSFSEWQEGAFGVRETWRQRAVKEGWRCLAAFGSEESRIEWNKRCRPTVERIPLSVDAFTVTGEMMDWMKRII